MTLILNGRNREPSITAPVGSSASFFLAAGSVYRWQCIYAEYDTVNATAQQYEGPYLRITPCSPRFRGIGQTRGPYSTFDGRDVAGLTALNPRAVLVGGALTTNEAQNDGKFYYEIDAMPGGVFVAPFDCSIEFQAYAPGYWVFGGGIEDCGEPGDEMAPHLALARITIGAQRVYPQTRWCNNNQNLNGLGAGIRRVAIPNGCFAFRNIGYQNASFASFDLIGEESPSAFDTNEAYAGSTPGSPSSEVPVGNARYLVMRCGTVAPERAGVAFQIRMV